MLMKIALKINQYLLIYLFFVTFSGKCLDTGKKMALKQERPANLWELYICMELKARLDNPSIVRYENKMA